MKKGIIIVLTVAVLAGLAYIGFSDKTSAGQPAGIGGLMQIVSPLDPEGNVKVSLPSPPGPTFIPIVENYELESGSENRFRSDWINAKPYREFKLYARMPYDSLNPAPNVRIRVGERPMDGASWYGYVVDSNTWQDFSGSSTDQRYCMIGQFSGLYSAIQVEARNSSGQKVYIDLYLLMAR